MSQKFLKSSKWPVYFLSAQGEFLPVPLGRLLSASSFQQLSLDGSLPVVSPSAEEDASVLARGLRPAQARDK